MQTVWRPCGDHVEAAVGEHRVVRVAAWHTCAAGPQWGVTRQSVVKVWIAERLDRRDPTAA